MKSKEQQEEDKVTIPLRELLQLIVGTRQSGSPYNPVPPITASILSHKLQRNTIYKMDMESDPPKLWWRKDWDTDTINKERRKNYEEKERVKRWLFRANVDMLAKAILRKTPIPENDAMKMASMMLNNPNGSVVIQSFFGVTRLKDKIEDLA